MFFKMKHFLCAGTPGSIVEFRRVFLFLYTILSVEFHAPVFPSTLELGVASSHNANVHVFRFESRSMRQYTHGRHCNREDSDHYL